MCELKEVVLDQLDFCTSTTRFPMAASELCQQVLWHFREKDRESDYSKADVQLSIQRAIENGEIKIDDDWRLFR